MKMKYYLIFLALLLSFGMQNKAVAQKCLVMDYDSDGNRIRRTVTTNCLESRDVAEVQENLVTADDISVYPNPNDGMFRVFISDCVKKENSHFELYDLNGVQLFNGNINGNETDIDIGIYPVGVYLLKIYNGEDMIFKIILKQ